MLLIKFNSTLKHVQYVCIEIFVMFSESGAHLWVGDAVDSGISVKV